MTLTSDHLARATAQRLSFFAVLFFAIVMALVVLDSRRAASNADWLVLAASGEAEWRGADVRLGGWQSLEVNGRVPDGAEIRTGGNGYAVVAKGLDRIEIRPGTELVVAARQSRKGALEIDQTAGSATYTIEKRPAGTFSVHTPYVVAVVKGTKFGVDVTRDDTSVSVEEGTVGVSDRRGGDSVDVTPGQRARSSRGIPGIDVEITSSSRAAPAANPNTAPNAGTDTADSPPGASDVAPGRSGAAPGRSGEAPGRSGEAGSGGGNGGGGNGGGGGGGNGGGSGGGNGGGSGGGNGGGNGGGSGGGNGGGSGGGNGGGSGGGNGGGNGNGNGNGGGKGQGK